MVRWRLTQKLCGCHWQCLLVASMVLLMVCRIHATEQQGSEKKLKAAQSVLAKARSRYSELLGSWRALRKDLRRVDHEKEEAQDALKMRHTLVLKANRMAHALSINITLIEKQLDIVKFQLIRAELKKKGASGNVIDQRVPESRQVPRTDLSISQLRKRRAALQSRLHQSKRRKLFWANTLTVTQEQLRDWRGKLQAIRKKQADMHVQYRKLSHQLNPTAHRLLDALRGVAALLQNDVAYFSRKFGGSSQEIMELTSRVSNAEREQKLIIRKMAKMKERLHRLKEIVDKYRQLIRSRRTSLRHQPLQHRLKALKEVQHEMHDVQAVVSLTLKPFEYSTNVAMATLASHARAL